jgi:butyrate kinase
MCGRFRISGAGKEPFGVSAERVLAVNPGGMSTKIAVYEGGDRVFDASVEHPREELARFKTIPDQLDYRKEAIERALEDGGQTGRRFDAVVGRGGLLKPIPSGVYAVNDEMIEDARAGFQGQHASNLGALLAKALSGDLGGVAFIADPVSVDEFGPLARYSGLRDIERKSLSHALNIKATAKKAASSLARSLGSLNLIVAHLGSGISITPLDRGRIVDASNASSGGPFSPERTGGLPLVEMLDYMDEHGYGPERMKAIALKEGGLQSYLGTNRLQDVIERIEQGDAHAREVVDAMAYQIAKEIGAMATVLRGDVDAIVLTGAMAHSEHLVSLVRDRASFIAGVFLVLPGENELESLAEGALSVLRGEEQAKIYPTG